MENSKLRSIYEYSINNQTFNQWLASKIPDVDKVKVLELGSNSGLVWHDLKDRFRNSQIIICDDNPKRLEVASKNLSGQGFEYKRTEFHKLPFEDSELDLVVSNHNLYRSKDLRKVLSEVNRVLRDGGIFVVTTNSTRHLKELSDLMTPYGVDNFFGKGLINTFDYENGADKLDEYFEVVAQSLYENVMPVNDIASILSYLKSLDNPQINLLLQVRRMELISYISNIIVNEGSFRITARPGMFICIKRS